MLKCLTIALVTQLAHVCKEVTASAKPVTPLTLPANLTVLETIITWSSLSDAFTDSCIIDYEVVSLLSGSVCPLRWLSQMVSRSICLILVVNLFESHPAHSPASFPFLQGCFGRAVFSGQANGSGQFVWKSLWLMDKEMLLQSCPAFQTRILNESIREIYFIRLTEGSCHHSGMSTILATGRIRTEGQKEQKRSIYTGQNGLSEVCFLSHMQGSHPKWYIHFILHDGSWTDIHLDAYLYQAMYWLCAESFRGSQDKVSGVASSCLG